MVNGALAIIRGNAELLQMSTTTDAEDQEEVSEILTQAGRISRITSSLLTLARQDKRQVSRFPWRPFLMKSLIRSVIRYRWPATGLNVAINRHRSSWRLTVSSCVRSLPT